MHDPYRIASVMSVHVEHCRNAVLGEDVPYFLEGKHAIEAQNGDATLFTSDPPPF